MHEMIFEVAQSEAFSGYFIRLVIANAIVAVTFLSLVAFLYSLINLPFVLIGCQDAQRRGVPPTVVMLPLMMFGFMGLVVWTLIRPK